MAALTKHAPPINGGALFSYFKTHFRRTKRTVTIAYVFVFIFIAFTIFLAFTPSANPSSPWFASIFTITAPRSRGISNSPPSSYRSHFSSVYDYFFSNSSSSGSRSSVFWPPFVKKNETLSREDEVLEAGGSNFTVLPLGKPISVNQTLGNSTNPSKPSSGLTNQTRSDENHEKVEVLKGGNSNMTVLPLGKPISVNQTLENSTNPSPKPSSGVTNQTQSGKNIDKDEVLKGDISDMTVLPLEKPPVNQTLAHNTNPPPKPLSGVTNQTQIDENHGKVEVLKPDNSNMTVLPLEKPPSVKNNTNSPKPSSEMTNQTQNKDQSEENHEKVEGLKAKNSSVEEGIMVKNLTDVGKKGTDHDDDLIKSLMNCDLFDGNWVRDDSYPLYKPGSCSLIDEQFDCFLNGRPDNGYYKLKWKPKGCSLPRLNGSHMLELLRGKRLVFVGDSLNRNMWESLICILRNSVKDHTKVYEENGRHHFRTEASYSFVFEDYKCTVEFFVTPFLVQEWEVVGKDGTKKETLRLDTVSHSADKYKNADVIVFNTGHWWTHEKTALGKDYYQEGSHVYSELNVLEAFRKAITTWGRWIDANVDPNKSLVFFRGYSMSHFSGGQWNSGGQCNHETDPIKNDKYLRPYPPKMAVLEKVLRNMKTRVKLLNVTTMTDYRKDGHPSIYRKLHLTDEERRSPSSFQDCSHWCLPGVPDSWNEVLYAELLVKMNQEKRA